MTANDLLLWLAIFNGILSAAYLIYRWYWTARKLAKWESEQRDKRNAEQPPSFIGTSPNELDG